MQSPLPEEERIAYLKRIIIEAYWLTLPLDEEGNTFLHLAFLCKNKEVQDLVIKHANWPTLCETPNNKGETISAIMAQQSTRSPLLAFSLFSSQADEAEVRNHVEIPANTS